MGRLGFALLIVALAPGGDAFARHGHNFEPPGPVACYQGGTAYKLGDYCYTSCAPTAACKIEVCTTRGEWMEMAPCKLRDCRKVC